ncbi:hypothetical protein LG324_12885 [Phycicoccus jejuensis]|uniref:hypothetical protein n=1 Tax=Phycicoccus jejuensis TaxID=367299 RepID=UPI00384B69B6
MAMRTLPVSIYWGPDSAADLSTPEAVKKAYENIVRDGSSRKQKELSTRTCCGGCDRNFVCRAGAAMRGRPASPSWSTGRNAAARWNTSVRRRH